MKIKLQNILKWGAPILLFLLLSFDGKTHWDETNYLYKAAYAPFAVDVSWAHNISGFYGGRIFHIFILHGLFSILGPGVISLLAVEIFMAVLILSTGIGLYFLLKTILPVNRIPFVSFVAFLFAPLSLYLAYKSLAETTALFLIMASLISLFAGLKSRKKSGILLTILSIFFLFLATNSRVEVLLTFFSFVIPYLVFLAPDNKKLIQRVVIIMLAWIFLSVLTGLLTGLWSFEFLFKRFWASSQGGYMKDRLDYPPNYISAFLFGGSLWIFVLLSLVKLRDKVTRFAWGSLLLSMLPIVLFVEHNELRYYQPVLFSFALSIALGVGVIYDFFRRRFSRPAAGFIAFGLFGCAVLSNQVIRPIYEVGTSGFPLLKLMHRVTSEYDDPLIIMAHPHSTYAFLRVCCPDMRIALDKNFEESAPIQVLKPRDIELRKKPWLYLTPRGVKEKSLMIRLWNHFQGKEAPPVQPQRIPRDSWVTRSEYFQLQPVDREEHYSVYSVGINPEG